MKKKHEQRRKTFGGIMLACVFMLALGTIFAPATVFGFLGLGAASATGYAGVVKSSILLPMFAIQRDPGSGGGGGTDEEKKALEKVKALYHELHKETATKLQKLETDYASIIKLQGEYAKIEEKFKNLKEGSPEFKTLVEEHAALTLKVNEQLEKGSKQNLTMKAKVYEFIEKNIDKIKELKQKGFGHLEIEFKAADIMQTTSASNPDGIPELVGVQMAPPTNINLRDAIIEPLLTTFATSLASYPYTESIPKDGDFGFVLEKGEKPLIDFKIETRYAAPVKVAAHMELTEESVTDIPGLQSIAYDYLRKKHNLKKQRGILFGDGTSGSPKGIIEYARAFTAGPMANSVPSPNIMDVIQAMVTDIFTTHNYEDEMPYTANIALMNPIDFYIKFVAAKDGFGHPLYPQASLFNRVVIGGVLIIPYEHAELPPNSILVGDLSKYNITNYVPYTVRIGWINDQFIKNEFCIVGESRFHAFVKKLDEVAFIWDNIDRVEDLLDGDVSS